MELRCPFCGNVKETKTAAPGQYTVRCVREQCRGKFAVKVYDDPAKPPKIVALEPPPIEATQPTGAPANPDATAPHVSEVRSPDPGVTSPHVSGPGIDEATGAHVSTAKPTLPEARRSDPTRAASTDADANEDAGFSVNAPPAKDGEGSGLAMLGGYRILKELGRGGMGAVFLAKQMSLDRFVAVKVMNPEWSRHPTFLARFTREAYAAAQLVHHNVVQIYDIGEDRRIPYFSMEFVDGQNLADVVRAHGKLDVEVAVGYVLQAARGLKFAHEQGMVHRDIKPANLMLNHHGVVKVADLGLVKAVGADEPAPHPFVADPNVPSVPDSVPIPLSAPGTASGLRKRPTLPGGDAELTQAQVAMGTPSYMAPEQAEDASKVDHRADIYSLGCTLYVLLTGRPPFEGKTLQEVMSKHATEPIVPPDALVKRVPKTLSAIIQKMVAKKPEERYGSLDEVIKALEGFLGISSSGPFTPKEEHAATLEDAVKRFRAEPLARIKLMAVLGFFAFCALVFLLGTVTGRVGVMTGAVGLALLTTLAYFTVHGIAERAYLFSRFREYVFGGSLTDWLTWIVGIVLIVTVLWLLGMLWTWVALTILGTLAALALYFAVDRPLAARRASTLDEVEEMLKSMRLQGLDEDALRRFVCNYSGDQWEEFYEALFGYEAKVQARRTAARGERGRERPRFAAWRDPLVSWIDAKQQARREARERKLIEDVEARSLTAQGVSPDQVRRSSKLRADALVSAAVEFRQAASVGVKPPATPAGFIKQMREVAAQADKSAGIRRKESEGRFGPLEWILGPQPRFLIGAALLVAFGLWANQNELFSESVASGRQLVAETIEAKGADLKDRAKDMSTLVQQGGKSFWRKLREGTEPLKVPFLSTSLAQTYFNSVNPGIAGLILVLSSFVGGIRIAFFVIPAAVVALAGTRFGLPSPWIAAAGAGVLGVLGFIFGRSRR